MTVLSALNIYLQEYRDLPHHNNPQLAEKLDQVQTFQRNRMSKTHTKLFSNPRNQPMAEYFLNNLYGGEKFDILAHQLERIAPKAKKLEKFAPSAALETGAMGIRTAITATKLDLELAQWLIDKDLPVTEENIWQATRSLDAHAARQEQIEDLREVCYRTDKYLNSFLLQKAFKLAKGRAYKYNYRPLYDFIDTGFNAMKPLKSVSHFIEPFCEGEMAMIEQVRRS